MATIINRDDAVDYCKSETRLLTYATQSEDAITAALAAANGESLAALRRSGQYEAASIDALTYSTAPGDLKSFTLARFMYHLTKSGEKVPESITKAAEDAQRTLSFIATGNYIVEGINAVSTPTVRQVKRLYRGDGARVFDREDACNDFNYRDPSI